MATTITRYVNTASSAGGDGTTNATSGSARAYASLDEALVAEASARPNLVANDEVLDILCCGAAADTADAYITGFTTDPTRYLQIRGNPSDPNGRHEGVWSTSKYRVSASVAFGHAVFCEVPFTRLVGFQIENTAANGDNALRHQPGVTSGNDASVFDALILRGNATSYGGTLAVQADANVQWRNCVFQNAQNGGNGVFVAFATNGPATAVFDNCAFVNNAGGGFTNGSFSNVVTLRNCYAGGNGGNDFDASGSETITTCYSEDGSASTTTAAWSTSAGGYFTNVTPGSEDVHIGASSTLRGNGTDLSAYFTTDIDNETRSAWDVGADEYAAPTTPILDQEGARFGADDGSESAHGWLASQDANVTRPLDETILLRLLVNATNDPSSAAYSLRYQKNGSGGYSDVPVGSGSTSYTSPPAAPSATVTTVGSASASWNLNRPSAAAGDLVAFVIAWDDSTTVTGVTPPAGPNGETAVAIVSPQASASTEMRIAAWYYIATGAWAGGTAAWTPSASETCRAVAFVVPTGQFNAADPIGWSNTRASAGTAESSVNSPTGTTEADDLNGRMYIAFGSDVDALTAPGSNWNTINNATGGGVGLLVGSRDALAGNSESVTALTATIASDSWATLAFVVKPHADVTTNELYVAASANIAAGGEATTARLTAPTGKTTGDFLAGRRWDDENGSDALDLGTDQYTELEWAIRAQSPATTSDYFDFRAYVGVALDTYTVTPRWTIGSAEPDPSTGTAAGTGTAAATGSSLAGTAGTSAGVAAASAAGTSLADTDAAAAGSATVSATGDAAYDAEGTTDGAATASAVGSSLGTAAGSSAGVATSAATGASLADTDASSAGTATAAAAGASTADANGTSAGSATASAEGVLQASDGTASGVATAAAAGSSLADTDGSSSGVATASAAGASLADASGTASGVASASASAEADASAGTSAGAATAAATGSSLADADGSAAGTGTASAVGASLADADGTSAGSATVSASSAQFSTGAAAGTGTGAASGSSLADSAGAADGGAAASATGSSLADATGASAGVAAVSAVGSAVGSVTPQAITVSGETWATPQIAQQQWYAATVTSETWRTPSLVETFDPQ